jgi:hypothetical protein
MALLATPAIPSNSNLQGGIAGLVASLAVGFLTHAGYVAVAAAAIGCPEATIAVVATGIIGMGANVLITHIAELKNMDEFVKQLQELKAVDSFPAGRNGATDTQPDVIKNVNNP